MSADGLNPSSTEDTFVSQNGELVHLSKRELEILRAINTDAQRKVLALKFNISINTLNQHLRNIYQKFGVHTRIGAIIIANKNKFYDNPRDSVNEGLNRQDSVIG